MRGREPRIITPGLKRIGSCSGGFLSPASGLDASGAPGHGRCSAHDRRQSTHPISLPTAIDHHQSTPGTTSPPSKSAPQNVITCGYTLPSCFQFSVAKLTAMTSDDAATQQKQIYLSPSLPAKPRRIKTRMDGYTTHTGVGTGDVLGTLGSTRAIA